MDVDGHRVCIDHIGRSTLGIDGAIEDLRFPGDDVEAGLRQRLGEQRLRAVNGGLRTPDALSACFKGRLILHRELS